MEKVSACIFNGRAEGAILIGLDIHLIYTLHYTNGSNSINCLLNSYLLVLIQQTNGWTAHTQKNEPIPKHTIFVHFRSVCSMALDVINIE